MAGTAAAKSFDRLVRLARRLRLEDVAIGTTHGGAPALRVHDRPFVSIREPDVMILHCPFDAKQMLLDMAPEIYFETPHFEGWPGLMVRMDRIGDEELMLRLENAWRFRAPKKLAAKRPTAD